MVYQKLLSRNVAVDEVYIFLNNEYQLFVKFIFYLFLNILDIVLPTK